MRREVKANDFGAERRGGDVTLLPGQRVAQKSFHDKVYNFS